MRKYFLLSAAAMLMSTTANATTDYAEVTAKATIEVARQFECTDFDFGTIVIKENNPETTVVIGDGFEEYDESIILDLKDASPSSVINYGTNPGESLGNMDATEIILRASGSSKVLTAEVMYGESDTVMDGILTIPADVESGEYSGTTTVKIIY